MKFNILILAIGLSFISSCSSLLYKGYRHRDTFFQFTNKDTLEIINFSMLGKSVTPYKCFFNNDTLFIERYYYIDTIYSAEIEVVTDSIIRTPIKIPINEWDTVKSYFLYNRKKNQFMSEYGELFTEAYKGKKLLRNILEE
jgi:hypothetical protein